jgi:EAL domain-containing protein (putative c-di-GMP-specific phosphodiesterase class I)
MPNLDGLAFMRAAANFGYPGQIVIVSGERGEILRSAQRLGEILGVKIAGTLKKPIQPADLSELIQKLDKSEATYVAKVALPAFDQDSEFKLVPHYQPQYVAETRSILGFEALARIETPLGLAHGAGHLFNRDEKAGKLFDNSMTIMSKVLADMAKWRTNGLEYRVSINLDARVFDQPGFAPELIEMVRQSGVPEHIICLELTETSLPSNLSHLIEILTRFRIAGFELSLDDFGTGASNYELLRLCPFNELKVDASIIKSAAREVHSRQFLDVAVAMAKSLGMTVIAEGVETVSQLEVAKQSGIRIIQGFLFSEALTAAEAHRLIIDKAENVAVG